MTDIPNTMSVKEIINTAFGESHINVVNHKLIHTILVILARQLRLLERRVGVEFPLRDALDLSSSTSLSVTEVVLEVNVPSKKKDKSPTDSEVSRPKIVLKSKPFEQEEALPAVAKVTSKTLPAFYYPTSSLAKKSTSDRSIKTQSDPLAKIEVSSVEKTSTEPSPRRQKQSTKHQYYQKLLEDIEIQRERELRIIRQRTDSREERNKTPTPIASLDSIEKHYEKLRIVEQMSTDQAKAAHSDPDTGLHEKKPILYLVTKDEFAELATIVQQLQDMFKVAGISDLPENIHLLNDLRKGASLSDAMTTLQISAKIEAVEKALEKMISLITDLAINTRSINIKALLEKSQGEDGKSTSTTAIISKSIPKKKIVDGKSTPKAFVSQKSKNKSDPLTYKEFHVARQELYDDFSKMVTTSSNRCNTALKITRQLERRLDDSLKHGDRLLELEKSAKMYANQIKTLNTGIALQMVTYQEQLTQIQHYFESGLKVIAESITHRVNDTTAIAELNSRFRKLQTDIETAVTTHNELSDMQGALSVSLQSLLKEVKMLKDTKSGREEVAFALMDKARLDDLNGLVSCQEFNAIFGNIEKLIGSAYEVFNDKEMVWGKTIYDLVEESKGKANWMQMISLQGSINQYLKTLNIKIRAMEKVVGEPRSATVSRKLHREAVCLSCATPAYMELDEFLTVPLLPAFLSLRPPAMCDEPKFKVKEDR